MVLVHPGDVILPELGTITGEVCRAGPGRTGHRHPDRGQGRRADPGEGVRLSDGTTVAARTVVWTAGTAPNPVLEPLACPKERGRVRVTQQLDVPGHPGIWALGDCAAIPDGDSGKFFPPTAQHAIREARVLADNLIAQVEGRPGKPFRFPGLGQLAAIGRRTGVAQILGFRFSGFIAWLLWRTIYLAKLPRFERKVRVALDWALDLVFTKDLVEFHTGRSGGVGQARSGAPGRARAAAPESAQP